MNKAIIDYAIGGLLALAMYLFGQAYIEVYKISIPDIQDLYYAISSGIIAIVLHFFKNYHKVKNIRRNYLIFDSLELLVLITAPVFASFEIIRELYPNDPNPLLALSVVAIFSWYLVTVYRTNNEFGKYAFTVSSILYAGLMVPVGFAAWLLMVS